MLTAAAGTGKSDSITGSSVAPGGVYGFPLILEWIDWDNSEHEVTYTIDGNTLVRSYSIDGAEAADTLVAQYINSTAANTTCDYSDRLLSLRITATVGAGNHILSITREREIIPRPGL